MEASKEDGGEEGRRGQQRRRRRRREGSVGGWDGTERARGARGRHLRARPPRELLGDHLVRLREGSPSAAGSRLSVSVVDSLIARGRFS